MRKRFPRRCLNELVHNLEGRRDQRCVHIRGLQHQFDPGVFDVTVGVTMNSAPFTGSEGNWLGGGFLLLHSFELNAK